MAREDSLIDEGATFGRRRRSTPTTPATAAEVQAAIDAASTELGTDRAIPNEAAANLFAPIGGGVLPENPSVGDMNLFTNEGFTPGPIPEKYRKLFGNDSDILESLGSYCDSSSITSCTESCTSQFEISFATNNLIEPPCVSNFSTLITLSSYCANMGNKADTLKYE